MGVYERDILPLFPHLDIHLSSTPLMSKDEYISNIFIEKKHIFYFFVNTFDYFESMNDGFEGLVHANVLFSLNEDTINKLPPSIKVIANHGAGYV